MSIKHLKNRNGDVIDFDRTRIERAVEKTLESLKREDEDFVLQITDKVIEELESKSENEILSIEDVQDELEKVLMASGETEVAKAFIIYRNEKAKEREELKNIVLDKLEAGKLKITKKSGKQQLFSKEKIKDTYKLVSYGLARHCKFEDFYKEFKKYVVDGIKTSDISKMMIKSAIDLISVENTKWQFIAGRLSLIDLYKQASINRKMDVRKIYEPEQFLKLFKTYIDKGLYYEDFFKYYTEEDILTAGKYLKKATDFEYNYSTMTMYRKRYLLNPNKVVWELPQEMYMAAALFLAIPEKPENRVKFAKKIYDACSTGKISLPTPTLQNARTKFHQLSSCFKLNVGDSLDSITKNLYDAAQISKFGGGIGAYFGHVRAKGSSIRRVEGASGWVLPFLKMYNDTAIAVNQLGCVSGDSQMVKLKGVEIDGKFYNLEEKISFNWEKISVKDFIQHNEVKYLSEKVDWKSIKKWDYILSYNVSKNIDEFKEVLETHRPIVPDEKQVKIITENWSDVITSKIHPTLIERDWVVGYIDAWEILETDLVVSENWERVKIVSLQKEGVWVDENFIDFEIDWNNNYYASRNNTKMLVMHNSRAWAISPTLDVFHLDIFDFLEIQTETGDIRMKSYDLFPAVSFPDLFFQRMEEDGNWSLFDPKEIVDKYWKRLEDHFNEEFNEFYQILEKDEGLKLKKTVKAKELFKHYMKVVVETGMPYMFFRDESNRKNPNKHKGNIYSSQLCTEIFQNTQENGNYIETYDENWKVHLEYQMGEQVVCNLASINVAKVNTKEEIEKIIPVAIRILDNVVTLNFYPTKESEATSKKYRSIGLGTMGLAHHFAKSKMNYGSPQSVNEAGRLQELIAYYAIKESINLAKERGTYELFEGSEWSKWLMFGKNSEQLQNESRTSELNWSELASNLKEFGLRNAYLMAIAPNTSTSSVIWTTAWVVPVYKKYFVENNQIAPLVQVAPDLEESFWYYKEYVNMDMNEVIDVIAEIQKYVDQGISFEWLSNPNKVTPKDLYNYYIKAHKLGLKSIYYVRSMSMEVEKCESCAG